MKKTVQCMKWKQNQQRKPIMREYWVWKLWDLHKNLQMENHQQNGRDRKENLGL